MSHYDNSRAFDNYDAWLTTDPSLDAEEPPVNDCVIDLVVGLLGDDGTPWKNNRTDNLKDSTGNRCRTKLWLMI